MPEDAEFRTIQSIGRSELIEELTRDATVTHDNVLQGVGDDAAVIETANDGSCLLSSETFMEGVDFDLTYTPLHHLGYKVLSSTVSDIYAMNGQPSEALIDLAVPNKLSVDMLQQIYKGLYAAGIDFDVQIVGGDLTASHQTLSISVSCRGTAQKKDITYRSGAREDDLICVSGDLGGAIAGLRILMREKEFWENENDSSAGFEPNLEQYEYVVKRQLVPKARNDLINALEKASVKPHAMIDITQGLVSELHQITQTSEMGAEIYQAAIPVALETRNVANEMKEDVDKYALYGGEDLELLFTMPEKRVHILEQEFDDMNVIGKMIGSTNTVTMKTAEGNSIKFSKNEGH